MVRLETENVDALHRDRSGKIHEVRLLDMCAVKKFAIPETMCNVTEIAGDFRGL